MTARATTAKTVPVYAPRPLQRNGSPNDKLLVAQINPLLPLGDALALLGWHSGASRVYASAAAGDPGSPAVQRRLGESLARCGRWRSAAESYRQCVRLGGPNPPDLGALVLALWKAGQRRAALERLDEMRRLDPASGELLLLKATLLAKLGRQVEAVRTYRLTASFAVEPHGPRFLLAERLLGAAKWDAAVDAWRAAAVIRRSRFPCPAGRARPETARPRASAYATLRAGLLMRIGRRRSALRALRAAVAARNPAPARRFRIGELLLGVRGWQAARGAYTTVRAARDRARRVPARALKGGLSMPAAPPAARSARREAPRSGFGARLALTAASLCALVLAVGLVASVRGNLTAASALDGPEARRLTQRCTTLSGAPGLNACELALAMPLSPVRASIVRAALAQKRARAATVPPHLGVTASLDSKARP